MRLLLLRRRRKPRRTGVLGGPFADAAEATLGLFRSRRHAIRPALNISRAEESSHVPTPSRRSRPGGLDVLRYLVWPRADDAAAKVRCPGCSRSALTDRLRGIVRAARAGFRNHQVGGCQCEAAAGSRG